MLENPVVREEGLSVKHPSCELPPDLLRARFEPSRLPFLSTEELPSQEAVIGQERAVRAMDFGLQILDRGYNIYVCGAPGTGKSTIVKSMIRRVAERQPTPGDWCYVNNFQDPDRPHALSLPAGKGREFQKDMERLIASLRTELPRVFQSKDFEDQRRRIEEEFSHVRNGLTAQLEERAREHGFMIKSTHVGMVVVPIHRGRPIEAEEVVALDAETRGEIERKEKDLHEHLRAFLQQVRDLREEMGRKIAQIERQAAEYTSEHAFESLKEKYGGDPRLSEHIQAVRQDVLENFKDFLPEPESPIHFPGLDLDSSRKAMTRYAVNVIVDNGAAKGAPVVEEINPNYNNLIGRIEKRGRLGTFYTDFTMIKAGALLQANGGYLLLNALDLLRNPFSWDALKRVIKHGHLKIEDIGELYGLIATAGLKPEPIPIRLRVVLIGSPYLYYLLHAYDEDFGKICKVKADFDLQTGLDEETPLHYARFIARICREDGIPHFDREAVAAVLEQTARWADHQRKLSLRFSDLADLVREAAHWASRDGEARVSRKHVQKAVEEKIYRSNLLEERIRELTAEGTLRVDVTGSVAGQVNGLSVHQLGDFAFGRPSRITARVFMGQSGIINIEREARLSGRTHSKGVMILAGYLGGRYAREFPLSLSASLCFEQSYGEVEGDSASAAELAALLSSLSGIPIRQGLAITGSVNQRGELQAIGGVNEKIEGFYAVCKMLGLTGDQGVVIPRSNVPHLMLREEVVGAAADGRFHVYAAGTADEAIEILTGVPAGEPQPDGSFPEGSLNAAVLARMAEMGERLRALEAKARPEPVEEERSGDEDDGPEPDGA